MHFMRSLILLLLLAATGFGQFRFAYNSYTKKMDIVGYQSGVPTATIAAGVTQLPAATATNAGWVRIVTDTQNCVDQAVGVRFCRSDGSVWAPLGDGTGSGSGLVDPGANGVLKRTALNVTAAATAGDITGLFSGTGAFLKSDGTKGDPVGSGDVTGPALSVDGELVLFSGTGGKTLKRATTSGLLKASSGVLGAAVAGTDYEPALGNPDVDGKILSSTAAGARSWVTMSGGMADPGSNGILKRTALNTTAVAVVGDVTGLFSGVGDYLKSDGTRGTPTGAGDVSSAGNLSNNVVVVGDGGTKAVKSSNVSFTGPTQVRTFTLPDADKTLMATDTAVQASQIASGLVTPAKLSVIERHFVIPGSGASGVLQDTDDQPAVWFNQSSGNMTVQSVWCLTNSATPTTIQLQKNDGSPADMFAANLSCSNSKANTSSFVSGENVLANGDNLNFAIVSAGGAATWVAVHFTVTHY